MNRRIVAIACLAVAPALLAADDTPLAEPATAGTPVWEAGSIRNEPLLFVQEEGALGVGDAVATGQLLFTPSGELRITPPDLATNYEPGRDFLWTPGTRVVSLPATSRIPFRTHAQLMPPKGSPSMFGDVFHSEGRYFHDLAVQASYDTKEKWEGVVPATATDKLEATVAKLAAKQALTVVALGDSITEGYNASGFRDVDAPPHQPPYPQLVANTLQERFGSEVTLLNLGRAGTVSSAGFQNVLALAAARPDVVLIAYGMNHSESGPEFGRSIAKLLDEVKRAAPGSDVVLVASMAGNPRLFPAERFEAYRDALKQLEGPGVAVADVTSVWAELLKRKRFSDLSGNHVNHPNDFGHRVYAQVIVKLFGE